ncbi:Putative Histone acetyltransferase subunit NuA4 [[Torrubiella] hemipterigena]|uniref:Chromatin modification-related protein EAF6 n=1 Tax=[Torrubiella] hemipterigena TaxID=1531966 RepID=A0A0A1T7I2_9HYPO|nr:Putative Histone acetyltransferase subunit NuA4 [[Torrubiella] hemipterigena]
MADKPSGPGDIMPTQTEYKKSQARVRDLVDKRRQLERRLNSVEEGIIQKESAYLENTPSGNIITGFDNYMKGISGAGAQRRKTGPMEQNRVFSRSSVSYRPSTEATPGSTPASHAPTPVSATFKDTSTPTGSSKASKSKKKEKEAEDSENDTQTTKKRTNFGASRK